MAVSNFFARCSSELGLGALWSSPWDTKILCLQRFVRLFAYGGSTLILALYLSDLGNSDTRIGLFMTLTLLGDVLISFVLTLFADGLGRRRILILGAVLMSSSGLVFALCGNFWVLLAASIIGVISPSGNEIGPFRAVEESTLAQLTPSDARSDIFAWYTLLGTLGSALGAVVCGWTVEKFTSLDNWTNVDAYQVVFYGYAALGVFKLVLVLLLSRKCEPEPEQEERDKEAKRGNAEAEGLLEEGEEMTELSTSSRSETSPSPSIKKKSMWPAISKPSQVALIKICVLFAVDSLAQGLVAVSWITYFFNRKFSLPEGQLGTLFFVTSLVSSASTLIASSISKRIGLVKTMVFTHLPSSVWLALIPFPSNVGLAMTFLVLRHTTASMDTAPRQAFVAAVVLPNERTAVMGVTNVVKTLGQSSGPLITGWLAGIDQFWIAFVAAGTLKIGYDMGMLGWFLGFTPAEERIEEEKKLPEDEIEQDESGESRK